MEKQNQKTFSETLEKTQTKHLTSSTYNQTEIYNTASLDQSLKDKSENANQAHFSHNLYRKIPDIQSIDLDKQKKPNEKSGVFPTKIKPNTAEILFDSSLMDQSLIHTSSLINIDVDDIFDVKSDIPFCEDNRQPCNVFSVLQPLLGDEMISHQEYTKINSDISFAYKLLEVKDDKEFVHKVFNEGNSRRISRAMKYCSFEILQKLIDKVTPLVNLIVKNQNGVAMLKSLYKLSKTEARQDLLSSFDYFSISNDSDYEYLLLFLLEVKDTKDQHYLLYKELNSRYSIKQFISNKYAKNLIEFIILNFKCDLSCIQMIIKENFISFSIMNYSTYVIQAFIYKLPRSMIDLVTDNLDSLARSRNGIFVIKCMLSNLDHMSSLKLLNEIIKHLPRFSKMKFASTLIENIVITYHPYVANVFISTMHKEISGNFSINLGLMLDKNGKYIIQKLVEISSGPLKLQIMYLLNEALNRIKNGKLKTKWRKFLSIYA